MSPRSEAPGDMRAGMGVQLAAALHGSMAGGYGRADFKKDLLAGITVGIVALPLSMALAIASGVPPQHGIPLLLGPILTPIVSPLVAKRR